MFQFIKSFLKRQKHRRLKRIMLGFRLLKRSNNLSSLVTVKQALTIAPLDVNAAELSPLFFGAGKEQSEIVIRQYLLMLLADLKLERALLYTAGKPGSSLVYYLPPQWLNIVQKQSVNVAKFRSALAWHGFIFLMLFYGLLRAGRILLDGLKQRSDRSTRGRYVYFSDLTPANLPKAVKNGFSRDVITWYSRWEGGFKNLDAYCHNVKAVKAKTLLNETPVIFVHSYDLNLKKFIQLFKFIVWVINAAGLAFIDIFRGRWWHAVLFSEVIKAKVVRLHSKEQLAVEYLFHNMIYRPLWTYEAEKKGAQITFYFYALWTEPFRCFSQFKNLPLGYGLESMNWPRYLVWDQYQADLVHKAVGKAANTQIVGSIWFADSAQQEMSTLPKNAIAVFDVSAMRESIYRILPVALAYYTPAIVNQFLSDICSVIQDFEGYLAFKRKRDIGNEAHPKYSAHVKKIANSARVIEIDPGISAFKLIEQCHAVISIPFTSTAVVARELGRPSIYYDPTGLVQLDDIEAHGIPIINTLTQLREWVQFILIPCLEVNS